MKHAYLLMVHKNTYTLEILLKLLDYTQNDIFVHVDIKCEDFDYEKYRSLVTESELIFLEERFNTMWGGYSQVKTEIALMEKAVKYGQHSYYHLLSGQDLPLISQEKLHAYFGVNCGREYLTYIPFDRSSDSGRKVYQRVSVKHFLQEYRTASKYPLVNKTVTFIDRCLLALQIYIFRVDRLRKKGINLEYGYNWFSLTEQCIKYILSCEDRIRDYFSVSSFCDELFVQTLLKESEFYNHVVPSRRQVVFGRDAVPGHAYVWTEADYDELVGSEAFFARKFDESVDQKIIDKIYNFVRRSPPGKNNVQR